MKRILCFLPFLILIYMVLPVNAQEEEKNMMLELSAKSAVLLEATTGKIIFEKNSNESLPPASVTKIMTLLLIFEDLANEKITLQDEVTVSAYAASMGGSQVFLEQGEVQTVDTLIKCIAVSSANDGCVAMAEYLNGSELAFVERMNKKAEELGMTYTHFVNCCGLDAEGHLTSANDIGIMSKELTTKYPDIFQYSTIWMEDITHKTLKGETEFGLSNTNKLIRQYDGCNGLKTGSTNNAKFCLSATATRNNISLIAVVMGCPDSKSRTADVTKLLDYGFSSVTLFEDSDPLEGADRIDINGGEKGSVSIYSEKNFIYPLIKGEGEEIGKNLRVLENIEAPIREGEILGEIDYLLNNKVIGTLPIYAAETIEKKTFLFVLKSLWKQVRLDT